MFIGHFIHQRPGRKPGRRTASAPTSLRSECHHASLRRVVSSFPFSLFSFSCLAGFGASSPELLPAPTGRATLAPSESSNSGYATSVPPRPAGASDGLLFLLFPFASPVLPCRATAVFSGSTLFTPLPSRKGRGEGSSLVAHSSTRARTHPTPSAPSPSSRSLCPSCLCGCILFASTSRARTNTSLLPHPKARFQKYFFSKPPLSHTKNATRAQTPPLSTHQHPRLCARQ